MGKSCKFCWGLSAVLIAGLAYGAYKFIVVGSVETGVDGRSVVLLSPDERLKVLGEMRGLLEAVQTITSALVDGDMKTVETTARSVGMAAAEGESPAMMAKLPLEFKRLGMSTHKAFDDLADLAAGGAVPMAVLGNLSTLMLNCTSCHQGYQLKATAAAD